MQKSEATIENNAQIINEIIKNDSSINQPKVYYSRRIIERNIAELRNQLGETRKFKLYYSIKANMNTDVLAFMSGLVDGFDVASTQEYLVGKSFMPSNQLSSTGYAVNNDAITNMTHLGTVYDFSSIGQLRVWLEEFNIRELDKAVRIGIRVRTNLLSAEGKNSRFGFDMEDLNELCTLVEDNNLIISQLHIHGGLKTLLTVKGDIEILLNWMKQPVMKFVSQINYGGSWDDLFYKNLLSQALSLIDVSFPNVTKIIEPGSLLVRNAGLMSGNVIDEQLKNNISIVTVNLSKFNASSWFSPNLIASSSNQEKILTRINGMTCYERDYFNETETARLSVGDRVYFYPVGAYYFTTHRSLHDLPFPEEIVVD